LTSASAASRPMVSAPVERRVCRREGVMRLLGSRRVRDLHVGEPAGTWVRYDGEGRPPVVDGPFAETKDLIAGRTVIDVDSYKARPRAGRGTVGRPGAGGKPIHEWLEVRPFGRFETRSLPRPCRRVHSKLRYVTELSHCLAVRSQGCSWTDQAIAGFDIDPHATSSGERFAVSLGGDSQPGRVIVGPSHATPRVRVDLRW
jgi:hypothetical protein